MPISSVHPKYKKQEPDWETMRDSLAGEYAIRDNIRKYLPPPPGMNIRGAGDINDILGASTKGIQSRYTHYISFAEWPEIVQMTLNAIQGLVHEKPPTVELPDDLTYLIDTATPAGDTLNDLWETVTRETLSTGRIGLLAEIFDDQTYICPYVAESITNWHVLPKLLGGGPTMVILREIKTLPKAEDPYEHEEVTAYREAQLFQPRDDGGDPIGEPIYRVRVWKAPEGKDPTVVVNLNHTDAQGWIVPIFFGQAWAEIPITINNAEDRTWRYGAIPLISAARRAISIFRKTADYFRSLYNKSDPQAILFGVSKSEIPGSIGGSEIWAFEDADGKAMYLDIDGQGIPLQREAIQDQYERFAQETGRLLDADDEGVKSGEALRREAAAHQVTVKSIVINAGASMQAQLRLMARLMGKPDAVVESIVFTPNLDFAEPLMTGREFMDYVLAKNAGGPLSLETIHELARRHKITDKTFEDEMAELEAEGPTALEIQNELDREAAAEAAASAASEDGDVNEDNPDDEPDDDDQET